ncbi:hypothetical protein [Bradyrhizobium sp. LHD-71]|uniref:hypothetical protein n=1 Tax=Bradyrhizobium sp. LHD-71 TaxID=3072141 RepID=UPI00280D773F|nr:hypothetical protein [Bradyrhizobium sp. LHD-71]MDQ8726499.1 hypothetical protein [Bradyrhizobium sp. LHD-71]
MRRYLIGLAAAMAVAAVSAPAMAGCGGCGPSLISSCGSGGYGSCGDWGYGVGWSYSLLPPPVTYYSVQPQYWVQPQYYYVNQGPTYTGPGMFAPAVSYQQRAVGGWSGYSRGYYGYDGGPYAHPTHHHYHGMPAVTAPTVYSYRRAYRHRYHGYSRYYGPRHRGYHSYRHHGAPRHSHHHRYH